MSVRDRNDGTLRGPTARSLPKGLNLSRVTARRHLEHLAVEGIVTLSLRYGGTGRPLYDWPG